METSFADECAATPARLIAYVGALALLGMVGPASMGRIAGGQYRTGQ
jgi:hypothetical protein